MKIIGFFSAFLLTVAQINPRIIDNSEDIELSKGKKIELNSLEKIFLQKNIGFGDYEKWLDEDDDRSKSEEYNSIEQENKRIDLNRRIFEIAGARFTPTFEALKRTQAPDMTDL